MLWKNKSEKTFFNIRIDQDIGFLVDFQVFRIDTVRWVRSLEAGLTRALPRPRLRTRMRLCTSCSLGGAPLHTTHTTRRDFQTK